MNLKKISFILTVPTYFSLQAMSVDEITYDEFCYIKEVEEGKKASVTPDAQLSSLLRSYAHAVTFETSTAFDVFKATGAIEQIKTLADEGNERAAYIYARLLMHTADESKKNDVVRYLRKAHKTEPRACAELMKLSPKNIYKHFDELCGLLVEVPPVERAQALAVATHCLKSNFFAGDTDAFIPLLHAYMQGEESITAIRSLCKEVLDRNLERSFNGISPEAFEYIKKLGKLDTECAYLFGTIFFNVHTELSARAATLQDVTVEKDRTNRLSHLEIEELAKRHRLAAVALWRMAQQRHHLSSTLMLTLHEPQTMGDYLSKRAAIMLFRVINAPREELAQMSGQLPAALTNLSNHLQKPAHLFQLGRLYTQGIDNLLKADRKQAQEFFKKGYLATQKKIDNNVELMDSWEKYMNETQLLSSAERLARQDALMAILDDYAFVEGKMYAAMILTKVYAYGRYGVRAHTPSLIAALQRVVTLIVKDPTQLKRFIIATNLLSVLPTGVHLQAHGIILKIYALSLKNEVKGPGLITSQVAAVLAKINPQVFSRSQCLYESSLVEEILLIPLNRANKELLAFFVRELLIDYAQAFKKKSKFKVAIQGLLIGAVLDLERIIMQDVSLSNSPFIKADVHLKELILQLATVANTVDLMQIIKQTDVKLHDALRCMLALLQIVTSDDYMTSSFKEGGQTLADLAFEEDEEVKKNDANKQGDSISNGDQKKNEDEKKQESGDEKKKHMPSKEALKQLLSKVEQITSKMKDTELQENEDMHRRLLTNFALAFLARCAQDISLRYRGLTTNIELCLYKKAAAYAQFCQKHDPVGELTRPKRPFAQDAPTVQLVIADDLVLHSHYLLLASNESKPDSRKAYLVKAQESLDVCCKQNFFYTYLLLGGEYILGVLFPRNYSYGKQLIKRALSNCVEEELSTNTLRAANALINTTLKALEERYNDKNKPDPESKQCYQDLIPVCKAFLHDPVIYQHLGSNPFFHVIDLRDLNT